MSEPTSEALDAGRPLSAEERTRMRSLLSKDIALMEIAEDYAHSKWLLSMVSTISKWVTAIILGVTAYINFPRKG